MICWQVESKSYTKALLDLDSPVNQTAGLLLLYPPLPLQNNNPLSHTRQDHIHIQSFPIDLINQSQHWRCYIIDTRSDECNLSVQVTQ